LIEKAGKLLRHAKGSPRWAAVFEDSTGGLHGGVSVAVKDLPAASLCAEPIALASLRLSGRGRLTRVLIVARTAAGSGPPCGRCLQLLREFGPKAEVRWGTTEHEEGKSSIDRLLPRAFGDYRSALKENRLH
jgi:cytidine deaminase